MNRRLRRYGIAIVATTALFGVGLTAPAFANSTYTCSSPYLGDMAAALAQTNKDTNVVDGQGAGIDDFVSCSVFSSWDADNMVDTYLSGRVYEYSSGSYSTCINRIPGWRGYWSNENQWWHADLDTEETYHCGWYTKPIKVRSIAKGLYGDGTIVSATAFVTDTQT